MCWNFLSQAEHDGSPRLAHSGDFRTVTLHAPQSTKPRQQMSVAFASLQTSCCGASTMLSWVFWSVLQRQMAPFQGKGLVYKPSIWEEEP